MKSLTQYKKYLFQFLSVRNFLERTFYTKTTKKRLINLPWPFATSTVCCVFLIGQHMCSRRGYHGIYQSKSGKKQFVSVTIRISGEFHHSFQRAEKRNLRAALAIRLLIVRNMSGFIAEDVNSYKNFHLNSSRTLIVDEPNLL